MKKTLVYLSFILIFLSIQLGGVCGPTIECDNPRINVIASESIYQGKKILAISIYDGKIPVNAPADRMKLFTDKNNNYKSISLKQISPGKFVTLSSVNTKGSFFKLKLPDNKRINDIIIKFKE